MTPLPSIPKASIKYNGLALKIKVQPRILGPALSPSTLPGTNMIKRIGSCGQQLCGPNNSIHVCIACTNKRDFRWRYAGRLYCSSRGDFYFLRVFVCVRIELEQNSKTITISMALMGSFGNANNYIASSV